MAAAERAGGGTTAAARLVFVTGASRSGTTMLARILGAHGRVFACNELHYVGALCPPQQADRPEDPDALAQQAALILARQTRGLWCGRPRPEELAWGRQVAAGLGEEACTGAGLFAAALGTLAAQAGKDIACEQTPRNIFYAERLLALYPQARVVHLIRDPRAVLASQKHRWKLRRLGADHLPWAEMVRNRVNYHPLTTTRLWAAATREALRLADHGRVLVLRFEALADDPAGRVRELCDFAGIPFEAGMLETPRWGSCNLRHTSAELGISRDVVDRWREGLSPGERLICETLARDLMARLGYAPTPPGPGARIRALGHLLAYPLHAAGVAALNPRRALVQLRALAHPAGAGARAGS